MELSTCCDAERWLDLESGICSECREHADFYEENETNKEDDNKAKEPESWYDRFGA